MRHLPDGAVEVEPGVVSILKNGFVFEARIDGNTVTMAGRRYRTVGDRRKWHPAAASVPSDGGGAVESPMPGKIVRLLVSEGDEVVSGQGVVVVEAMKMQNELKAPRAGRVAGVNVKENETVEAGAVLMVVE